MEEKTPVSIVHTIFNEFFGEENVDLQELNIIVHFPNVTVTNEHDKSVDITELWAKVYLNSNGTIEGGFRLMRSEYTSTQFNCGYGHSHITARDRYNFSEWASPCLGTGPIIRTIASLTAQFSEEVWELFCLELSRYVTVESLSGTPYMYLERIGNNSNNTVRVKFAEQPIHEGDLDDFLIDAANEFMPYILEKRPFRFNYANGSYGIALCPDDLMVVLSNTFIDWYNSLPANEQVDQNTLLGYGIIKRAKKIGNNLWYLNSRDGNSMDEYRSLIGRELFRFKDRTIRLNIIEDNPERDPNESLILSTKFAGLIVDRILRTINNKYGRQENTHTTRETLRYL